eukprot:scaffold608_cov120-Isochrysis_galbana.AAC.3
MAAQAAGRCRRRRRRACAEDETLCVGRNIAVAEKEPIGAAQNLHARCRVVPAVGGGLRATARAAAAEASYVCGHDGQGVWQEHHAPASPPEEDG